MQARITVVGSGALDSHFSVYFEQGESRILVNCPEGTQRLCTEHGVRLLNIDQILLTDHGSALTAGGLLGLLHTRGPVRPIHLATHPHAGSGKPLWDLVDIEIVSADRNAPPVREITPIPVDHGYIMQFTPSRGRFLPAAARAAGVPSGPDFARLTRGETVTLENGKVVRPEDVMEGAVDFGCALVQALPVGTDAGVAARAAAAGLAGAVPAAVVVAVEAEKAEEYVNTLIREIGSRPEHVVVAAVGGGLIRRDGRAGCLYRACLLAAQGERDFVIPLDGPMGQNDRYNLLENRLGVQIAHGGFELVISGKSGSWTVGSSADLKQPVPTDREADAFITKYNASSCSPKPVLGHLRDVVAGRAHARPYDPLGSAPAAVVTLGTGAAQPSRYRNVSSSMLMFRTRDGDLSSVVVDAGEGVALTLQSVFTDDELRHLLFTGDSEPVLHCAITHNHGDHTYGAWGLAHLARRLHPNARVEAAATPRALQQLQCMSRSFASPPFVLHPMCMHHPPDIANRPAALAALGAGAHGIADDAELDVEATSAALVDMEAALAAAAAAAVARSEGQLDALPHDFGYRPLPAQLHLGVVKRTSVLGEALTLPPGVVLDAVPAIHGVRCSAYSLIFRGEGWSVAFTGDTRPNPALVEAAQNVDILVHDSTHVDSLVSDAVAKFHSTSNEAVAVALRAHASALILTHFSQRYPMVGEAPPSSMTTVCAVDAAVVRVGQAVEAQNASDGFEQLGFKDV